MVDAKGPQASLKPPRSLHVGNDIVDLSDPEACGKSEDIRFVGRVLCLHERAAFDVAVGGGGGDELLWRLWTAKESAYKVLQKAIGASPTARSLEVSPGNAATGTVSWRTYEVCFRWNRGPDYVHSVAWLASDAVRDPGDSVTSRAAALVDPLLRNATLTPAEAISAHNPASAAARRLAKELLRDRSFAELPTLSLDTVEILRQPADRGWAPPEICAGGRPLPGWDVSLSHHGRFVAAAVSHAG